MHSAKIGGQTVSFTCHSALYDGSGSINSLAAIEGCLRAGASRIEIDIHSMADDDYLVCHANRLEEATTSRGAVGRLTRSEALQLRSSHGFSDRPPLLSEAVALMRSHECELQLDLKDWRPLSAERIAALGTLVEPLQGRVIVSSGQDWNLNAIAHALPQLRLGFDPDRYFAAGAGRGSPMPAQLGAYGYRDDHPLALGRAQPPAEYLRERIDVLLRQCPAAREYFIEYRLLLQAQADGVSLPELLHAEGLAVSAWTLDYDGEPSLEALRALAAIGVERITTNTTRQFLAALGH